MEKEVLLNLNSIGIKAGLKPLLKDINFSLSKGENLLITGPSGGGKTVLAKLISGIWKRYTGSLDITLPENSIYFLSQQADFSAFYTSRTAYYDQRYDGNERNASPLVKSLFTNKKHIQQEDVWYKKLSVSTLEEKRVHQLSNGESKRLQITLALLKNPKMLVLDNPFIGLDVSSRKILNNLIEELIATGISIILIGKPEEIPESINSIIVIENGELTFSGSRKEYANLLSAYKKKDPLSFSAEIINELIPKTEYAFNYAWEMHHVDVIYGDKKVLSDINWKVKKGERWALIGHNGAGKSTLLSLITADNPQGYKNDFKLFDRQRGSGESIWEIKNKIGFLSPELHRFFERKKSSSQEVQRSSEEYNQRGLNIIGINVLDAVTSGYQDQIGFVSHFTDQQKRTALLWLKLLGIENLKNKHFHQLSLGEQRLVLLARALVKNPPLLLLDEPCQGLDQQQIERFKKVLNAVCKHFNKTLIYVTHYENEIPSCVTKRIVLEDGKIIEIQN